MQRLLPLGVGKLQVEHTAMGFNNGHAVEFARGISVSERTEVSPVNLKLLSGEGFKADKGPSMSVCAPDGPEVISEDGDLPVEAHGSDALEDVDLQIKLTEVF